MSEITGPHGIREGKPFFFIHQAPESDKLAAYLQFLCWRLRGYEIFMACLGGHLIGWKTL